MRASNPMDMPEPDGMLARNVPMRLIDIGRTGCLLESHQRVENGTLGELRLQVDDEIFVDDVRVTRCVLVEGSGRTLDSAGDDLNAQGPRDQGFLRQLGAVNRRGTVMRSVLVRFIRDDEGQDLIEYGLLAGIITVAVVTAITAISGKVKDLFSNLNTAIVVPAP